MQQADYPPTRGEEKEEHVATLDGAVAGVGEEDRKYSEELPWRRKGPLLVLILLLTLGSNWAAGVRPTVLSPVKEGR
jgi:hypothetical protein